MKFWNLKELGLPNGLEYDFVDYGSHHGNSVFLAQTLFESGPGLATDNHPENIKVMRDRGLTVLDVDCRYMMFKENTFKFSFMSHFLEHLDSDLDILLTLKAASFFSTDFICIKQPYFDSDSYLASLGLKTVSHIYDQHTNHVTISRLELLMQLADLRDYSIYGWRKLADSHASDQILPSNARQKWTSRYDEMQMDRKELVQFTQPVFEEILVVIRLSRMALDAQRKLLTYWADDLHLLRESRSKLV